MRTQWIASLVSLSLSTGYAAHAQEALSTRPYSTTSSTTTASAATGTLPPRGGVVATAGEPNPRARDFRIPWSAPGAGVVPFEQATIGASKSPAKPQSVSRGAQVSPLSTDVKPNYVQSPRAVYSAVKTPASAAAPAAVAGGGTPSTLTASATVPLATSPALPSRTSRSLLDVVPWGSAPRTTPVATGEPATSRAAAAETLAAAEMPAAEMPAAEASAAKASAAKASAVMSSPAKVSPSRTSLAETSPTETSPAKAAPVMTSPSQTSLAEASSRAKNPLGETAPSKIAASGSAASGSIPAELAAEVAQPQIARAPIQSLPAPQPKPVPATTVAMSSVAPPGREAPRPEPTPSPLVLSESLIQPIPPEKLLPSTLAGTLPAEPPTEVNLPLNMAAEKPDVLVDSQPSASDIGPPVTKLSQRMEGTPAIAISNRFTDQQESPPSASAAAVTPPATRTVPPPPPLLTTESMIGPLRGAENLFRRLEIEQDLRDVAARIESGPRGDASNYAWMPAAYTWISPAFYHHPLYFEQPNLERYGQGTVRALQPLASSIHFFGSIPLVPYKTLTHHPRERVYTLGSLRPGNCVPLQRGVILGPSKVGEVTMFWEECSGY